MGTDAGTFDLLIRGGEVVTAEGVRHCDVGIASGRVVALENELEANSATRLVDADGKIVVPGAIDVHTHFGNRVGPHSTADDYASGTLSAAFGGITTIVNYCIQEPGESLVDAAERDRRLAEAVAMIDFSLHVIVVDPPTDLPTELAALAAAGCPSVKLFTAVQPFMLSDAAILDVMAAASQAGVVVNVHAEDGSLIDHLTRDLIDAGHVGIASLPRSRPVLAEELAIRKLVGYASQLGTSLYVVHVSTANGLAAIVEARASGVEVYAETRPAYLFLDESRYAESETIGRFVACWPPLRSAGDQDAMWAGLGDGRVQTYATDHTSWMAAEKLDPTLSFDAVPGGFANVETSIGMLYNEGVLGGRLSLERFVRATSTNPAKIFGLYPQKGQIALGADADLVVIDPAADRTIIRERMHSRSDVEPYAGYRAQAWPVVTVARGEVVVEDDRIEGEPGRGRYVARSVDGAARREALVP